MLAIETWTAFESGKYKGKTGPEVVVIDPLWFYDELDCHRITLPYCEVASIAYRASHIAIPRPDPEKWRIGWIFDSADDLSSLQIIPDTERDDEWSENEFLTEESEEEPCRLVTRYLSLYTALQYIDWNPEAVKKLSDAFTNCYFGGAEATKERCEDFFRGENYVDIGIFQPWDNPDTYMLRQI
jgi:hypothetical protein